MGALVTVVDLATGEAIEAAPETPNLVNSLKSLLARIESGELDVENFYLIVECTSGKTHSFDNGITACQAISMLEREKFAMLCALSGVGV